MNSNQTNNEGDSVPRSITVLFRLPAFFAKLRKAVVGDMMFCDLDMGHEPS